MSSMPGMMGQQALASSLAQWLLGAVNTKPGWDSLSLDLKPIGTHMMMRIREERSGLTGGNSGELDPSTQPYADAVALRQAAYHPQGGTWLSTTITVGAKGWPEPTLSTETANNFDDEPETWVQGEPALSAEVLLEDFTAFPRIERAVPEWVKDRVTAAGYQVPLVLPADSSQEPAAVVETAVPAGVSAESSEDELTVRVDRDGLELEGEKRPQRRQYQLPADSTLKSVLEYVGIPLQFTDGHGLWVVQQGGGFATDPLLAVVAQGVGNDDGSVAATIDLLTNVSPSEALAKDGSFYLYYRSVPGPVAEVTAAAREGKMWTRSRGAEAVNNGDVRAAVVRFAEKPGPATMLNVLRQALAGELLLDVTGSTFEPGSPLKINTVTTPQGAEMLVAFTNQEQYAKFAGVSADDGKTLAQPSADVLRYVVSKELAGLWIDPAGPTCQVGRGEIAFGLEGLNSPLKDVLATGPSMQEVFNVLAEPNASLLVADAPGGEGPLTVPAAGGGNALLAFTSMAEVAAYDSSLKAREFPAGWLAGMAVSNRLAEIRINPLGPSFVLSGFQLWHMLGNPALES